MKVTSSLLIITTAFLAACGGSEGSLEMLVSEGNLEDIRAKKKELSDQQKQLDKQIALLDSVISVKDTTKKLPLVTIFQTKEEVFNHFVELQGDVTTRQNVLIYPEVAGTLRKVYVQEGDRVSEGQLLASIDDGGMSSQLAQLKTQLTLAETTYQRQKRLWEQKIGTEIQYLQAKASYEAQLNQVKQFESQLSKYTVRAPFAGVIDDVAKDQGTVVAPGGPGSEVFRLVNLSDMFVEVLVPESYISDITPGKEVKVFFPILGKEVKSKVRQTSNFINPSNRSFSVEIPVPSLNGLVKPNLTAKVHLNDYTNNIAILIPQSVISENSDGEQYTYIASNLNGENIAKAQKNIIQTGKTQGDMVEFIGGLKAGMNVIQEGARSVQDGQEIKVLKK
ncbi:MAG: efflux RND transporter periplasmic adaptor subunit [Fulvivirga sp.]|uniref:efflux RND transporter periplasmic adaptor subunit n=1 Tax=Fulvivirga sp. TaxID=1931237 RepID=UPI0032EBB233